MSRDIDSESAAESTERADSLRGGRAAAVEAHAVEVKIEFGGLERRIHKVTRLSDNIVTAVSSPDSKTYAFVAAAEEEGRPVSRLYTIGADGEGLKQFTQSLPAPAEGTAPFGTEGISSLQFSRDGKNLYFLERGGIWAVGLGGGSAEGGAAAARGGAAPTATRGTESPTG